MAIEFGLPADTREKYGLPEAVPFDFGKLLLSEAVLLEDTFGLDMDGLRDRLWPEEGGRRDLRAWGFVIWLACRRAGAQVAYEDFDLDLYALEIGTTPVPDAGPKEPTPEDVPSIPESLPVDSSVSSAT